MSTESTTARIEAAAIKRANINAQPWSGADGGASGFEYVVTVEFARQLGRELDEANRKLEVTKQNLKLTNDAAVKHAWELGELKNKLEVAKKALNFYAKCDGCTCGDGWSHEPAVVALATINQKETK